MSGVGDVIRYSEIMTEPSAVHLNKKLSNYTPKFSNFLGNDTAIVFLDVNTIEATKHKDTLVV